MWFETGILGILQEQLLRSQVVSSRCKYFGELPHWEPLLKLILNFERSGQ